METSFIKKEPSESNLGTVTIKLEPEEGVDAKLYISNCQTCETPIEPRLSAIKKELTSPSNVKLEKESNPEELIHPAVGMELSNSPIISEVKESKSPNSFHLISSNQHFKRSRSLSSSSSNFSYKPNKLHNFHGPRPFAHHYRTNNNPYNRPHSRNFNRNRSRWRKFNRTSTQFNSNSIPHNASPESYNANMKIEIKPEMELRVVKMISSNMISDKVFLENNRNKLPFTHTHLGHQLQFSNNFVSNTSYYSENNNSNMNTVNEKMSLNKSILEKPEPISNIEENDGSELSLSNNLTRKPDYEENVPESISMLDNENSVRENNAQNIEEIENQKNLTVCVDGKETTYLVLDEVNDIENILIDNINEEENIENIVIENVNEEEGTFKVDVEIVEEVPCDNDININEEEDIENIVIENVNEEEGTFKVDVEIVEEVPCDNEIMCVFSKLKEAHLCTKCFVEKRRKKKMPDSEVSIIKKIDNHTDIPLIDIEH